VPGKGTTFHVYFPAADTSPALPSDVPEPVPLGRGERILFIDDEEQLVRLADRMLGRLGYKAEVYSEADLALRAFLAEPDSFAAVITDFNMPGRTGLELAREILAVRPEIGVILNSGHLSEDLRRRADEIGVSQVLMKPNTIEDIGRALRDVCGAPLPESIA
jgi:DNA-binding NtrC family response regulator